jgi:hypothetical protein
MSSRCIKRRDKEPIYDWRDMQTIKNEFLGKEATMVQVFPPERHLMDTANQYYFFGWSGSYELPFGFKQRSVNGREVTQYFNGGVAVQKPFEPHQMPETYSEDQQRFDDFLNSFQKPPK